MSAALAQTGQLDPGQVWANSKAAAAVAAPSSVSALLDRALGSTRGAILERGASGWVMVGPGSTAGLPWISAGAGADPSYAILGVTGGGSGASTAAGARTNFGLGTAAVKDVGTSGANVPLLSTPNAWGGVQTTPGLAITGSGSGTVTIGAQAAAGTPFLTLPNTTGTFAVGASSPLVLNAVTGNLTCLTCNEEIDLSVYVAASGAQVGWNNALAQWVSAGGSFRIPNNVTITTTANLFVPAGTMYGVNRPVVTSSNSFLSAAVAFSITSPAPPAYYYDQKIKDIIFAGSASATTNAVIYIDSMHQIILDNVEARTASATAVGLQTSWAINPHIKDFKVQRSAPALSNIPGYCIKLGTGVISATQTSIAVITNPICDHGAGDGITLTNAAGTIINGGAIQNYAGWGLIIPSGLTTGTIVVGTDFEQNTTGGIRVDADQTSLFNVKSSGVQSLVINGSDTAVYGGVYTDIIINSGAKRTDLRNVYYIGSFTDNGTGTSYKNLCSAAAFPTTPTSCVTSPVAISSLASIAANTVIANWTGSSAVPLANTYPSCADSGGNHLNYVSGTGVTCGTSMGAAAAGTLTGSTLASGVTASSLTSFGTSPTLVTPNIGVATATSINKVAITAPATSATLTIPNGVTLTGPAASGTAATLGNAEIFTGAKHFASNSLLLDGASSGATTLNATGTASGTLTLPAATDTLVGKATTDTFTNKTFDTAGTGNSFSINGVAATANTGTGAVARAAGPTFTTPTLGAATATTLNGNAFTTGTYTLTGTAAKTLTFNNSLTLAGTDATTLTFQGTDTYVGRTTTDTLTNKTIAAASNTLSGSFTGITGVGALTAGSTGAGFTVAFGTATFTGANAVANGGTACTSATGTCLDNITGFASTGILARTASGTYAFRSLGSGAGISITNPDGVAGAPSIAVSGLSTNTQLMFGLPPSLTSLTATNTYYIANGSSASETAVSTPLSSAQTIKNLYAKTATAPASSDTQVITVRKNGSDTTVTCTITGAATTCNDTTHSVAFAAGDLIAIKLVMSATAVTTGSVQYGLTSVTTSP